MFTSRPSDANRFTPSTPINPPNRLYHSSPTELKGTQNSLRAVRRLDALARLFQFPTDTPVTAISYHQDKLLFGFNSPKTKDGEFNEHCAKMKSLVSNRLQLLNAYFNGDAVKQIWPVVLELHKESRQNDEQVSEYPISDIFTDLTKIKIALIPANQRDEFLKTHKNVVLEILMAENIGAESALRDYERLLTDYTFRNQHYLFNDDSLDSLFFSSQIQQLFLSGNFEIVIEPQIINGDSYDTVHGEVALANRILSDTSSLQEEKKRENKLIGISRLNCSDCSNYFHMINKLFDDYHISVATNASNKLNLPIFHVAGTHSCEFSNWRGIMPKWIGQEPFAHILKRYKLDTIATKAKTSKTSIQLSPARARIGDGLVDDPIIDNTTVAKSPLTTLASEVASPPRLDRENSNIKLGNISPKKIKEYQLLSNSFRITIKKLRQQKTMILGHKSKIQSTYAETLAFVKELTQSESPDIDIPNAKKNKNKFLLKPDAIIIDLRKLLTYSDVDHIADEINSGIAALSTFSSSILVSSALAKKYQKLQQNIEALPALHQDLNSLQKVEDELSQTQIEQENAYLQVRQLLNLSPARANNCPPSPKFSANNNTNCNSSSSSSQQTEVVDLKHPAFGTMEIFSSPSTQKVLQPKHCTLTAWNDNLAQAAQNSTPEIPRRMVAAPGTLKATKETAQASATPILLAQNMISSTVTANNMPQSARRVVSSAFQNTTTPAYKQIQSMASSLLATPSKLESASNSEMTATPGADPLTVNPPIIPTEVSHNLNASFTPSSAIRILAPSKL